jgi:hypothetical protein
MKAILCLLASLLAANAAAAETRPIVVELFTSQSCSSCPPADALLGELARRKDVVALGFHVTYWDGPGWKDLFARQESTDRQIAYDRALTGGQVYTPQMVVDGVTDVVGSDREAILGLLAATKPIAATSIIFAADRRSVTIGAGSAPPGSGIVLARFAVSRTTHVGGGENASRTVVDTIAVEALTALGTWTGAAVSLPIEPPRDGEGLAVLVQTTDGRVLGAAVIPPPG